MKAARYLARLHSEGLVYCDISANNMFVSSDMKNSNVWLIDADNINFLKKTLKHGYYTNGYGAPEVISGYGCSFHSDVYALAISLFWQTAGTHPFKGPLSESVDFDADFADDNDEKAYSGEFPWIGDTNDTSNKGDSLIPYQIIFSEKMQRLFQMMFSEAGRTDPKLRPSMMQLAEQLAQSYDETIYCPECGMDYNYFEQQCCPWCDTKLPAVVTIKTYYSANGTKDELAWRLAANLCRGQIAIPRRILVGASADSCDEIAFEITAGNGITVKSLLSSVHFVADGSNFYGKVDMNKSELLLAAEDMHGIRKFIEIRIQL
jgi:serine/threonine protein kinase